uniref:Transporter n=1 Tax=Photinus pyralis TaxID=7054 RepID=A0A1Y1K687_PHOPY
MATISEKLSESPTIKSDIIVTKPITSSELDLPSSEEEDKMERGSWSNKLDFLFSCISLSVGLGNVWRFPYLCYKNGGGAFLVTYLIAMIFCGIPIFFQEVSIGQYLGSGGMTFVGQLCPLLKGVGYSTMTIVFLLDVYYCIIIAWTLLYFISTFLKLPDLPWSTCVTEDCYNISRGAHQAVNGSELLRSPVEEFFEKEILHISTGIEDIGGIQWKLFGCLVLGWFIIYLIIRKGLHQSGKIIWFTALCPYVILTTLLVRAVTLDGAADGLLYYITPRWSELLAPAPWMEGATQIFFAYSIGCGALPALGSYNKFNHNCYKDAVITCIVNTLTSILAGCVTFSVLGHMALEKGSDISNVVQSGPGLVFITYPEIVLKLPGAPFWAAAFFFMLLLLGVDSAFCLVESFVTGVVDNWPKILRPHRGKLTICICFVMFLLGIPMVTHGGVYIFQLMDYYSASGMSLLWVCFFQTIAISWVFGTEKLCDCIKEMIGMTTNRFLVICWKFCGPLVILIIFLAHCINYESLTYGKYYTYPTWAEYVGFLISFSSMVWVPAYAIYYVLTGKGSVLENLRLGLKPKFIRRMPSKTDDNFASIEQFI